MITQQLMLPVTFVEKERTYPAVPLEIEVDPWDVDVAAPPRTIAEALPTNDTPAAPSRAGCR